MITAGEILKLKGFKLVSADESTTIFKTIEIMVENKVGSIIVNKDGEAKGLWTERDLLRNITNKDFDIKNTRIGDCTLSKLYKVSHTTTLMELQDHFLGLFTRYLFVEKKGKIIGVLSSGDVMKCSLNTQKEEMKKLKSYVSMEYYENWSWDAKKR